MPPQIKKECNKTCILNTNTICVKADEKGKNCFIFYVILKVKIGIFLIAGKASISHNIFSNYLNGGKQTIMKNKILLLIVYYKKHFYTLQLDSLY